MSCFQARYGWDAQPVASSVEVIANAEARAVKQEEMLYLYTVDGLTLQEIGERYNITRERVRQILADAGVSRLDGGMAIRTAKSIPLKLLEHSAKIERQNKRSMKKWGCDFLTAKRLNQGRPLNKNGTIAKAYDNQRTTSISRGIAWEMTFPEWVKVWRDSGKYHLRGRGKGYWMARRLGIGPYSVANIYITSGTLGASDYQAELKMRGVRCEDGNRRLPEHTDAPS
jgi:hypothetical protein